MEHDWERRTPLPTIVDHEVVAALQAAGVTEAPLDIRPVAGGLVNGHLRLQFREAPKVRVLRVFLRDNAAADKEAAMLERVAGIVSAPAVLARGTLPAGGESRSWLLTTWIPGTELARCQDDLGEAALARAGTDVGAALGRLHALRTPHLGFLDGALDVPEPMGSLRATWSGYLHEMLFDGRAGPRLGPERRDALWTHVEEHVEALTPLEDHYSLLHADCKPTNVFVQADGALTGLLDWEFAWSGPPLFDIGQMLRWPVPAAFEHALLDAYRQAGGRVPDNWRVLAGLLDLMNLVGFLDQEPERPRQRQDVLQLLADVL